ncbi:hypothetical protein KKA66_01995 [Patescibacteria group bacterium]|nr:hypothetical protein [Patescibacteria group bacterium]
MSRRDPPQSSIHKKDEGYDHNNDKSREEYYDNYIALMIMENENSQPRKVYQGDVHTSYWEWKDDKHVIVYYGCGTYCLYAYEIDIESEEVTDEYHVYK